jgi:hypothetical protein
MPFIACKTSGRNRGAGGIQARLDGYRLQALDPKWRLWNIAARWNRGLRRHSRSLAGGLRPGDLIAWTEYWIPRDDNLSVLKTIADMGAGGFGVTWYGRGNGRYQTKLILGETPVAASDAERFGTSFDLTVRIWCSLISTSATLVRKRPRVWPLIKWNKGMGRRRWNRPEILSSNQ